jgi:hypothetical protein
MTEEVTGSDRQWLEKGWALSGNLPDGQPNRAAYDRQWQAVVVAGGNTPDRWSAKQTVQDRH